MIRPAMYLLLASCAVACGTPPTPAPPPFREMGIDAAAERVSIEAVLDDWHKAASEADEVRYFGHMAQDAVFMGTDATERWDKPAFRAYAHPHFEKGKAWSFTATRRAVMVAADGELAWFDEDLATPNLGPARGSGVLRKVDGAWLIVHYNLTITVPNERFAEVRRLLGTEQTRVSPSTANVAIEGRVMYVGEEPLPMYAPKARSKAIFCKDKAIKHNALKTGPHGVGGWALHDVLVRIALDSVTVKSPMPAPAVIASRDCVFEPRILGVRVGQTVLFENRDPMMLNVQAVKHTKQIFNSAMPKGAAPLERTFEETGLYRVQSSVQPWMRSFIWVSDHPFFAVTDENGEFEIRGVPDGEYTLEAWHSFMGLKTQQIRITGGAIVVKFEYDGSEDEPPENKGELDDLF